jgi:hypothetical protein
MEKEAGASQFFLIPVFVLLAGLVVGRKRQEQRRAKALPRHDNTAKWISGANRVYRY